jgi:hypothetical protein
VHLHVHNIRNNSSRHKGAHGVLVAAYYDELACESLHLVHMQGIYHRAYARAYIIGHMQGIYAFGAYAVH